MDNKTGSSRIGIVAAIILMILAMVMFQNGWVDKYLSRSTPILDASAATVSPEPAAPVLKGYAPDGSVIMDMGNPNFDTNVAYAHRKAEIDHRIDAHWARWREGDRVNAQTGQPQATVFAWDKRTVEDVLFGEQAVADRGGDTKAFLLGPDGKDRIPSFTYVFTSGLFRASIGDPDGVFRFNYDQSIKVVFVAMNEKGVEHSYSVTGYRGESGSVVFLQSQALSIMDLIMTSKSMVVRVPTFGDYREMEFDTKSFDAKPFLHVKTNA